MSDYAELVKLLRADAETQLDLANDCDCSPEATENWVAANNLFKAADAIEALVKERDDARAEVLKWQNLAANHEHEHKAAESKVGALKAALDPFIANTKTDEPVWYYETSYDIVAVRGELTVGEIRQASEAIKEKK